MADGASLQRLLTWLSPAFPVGAFAWSGGLETAITKKQVTDRATLEDWISSSLELGSAKTDAVLLAASWAAANDSEKLAELAELASALSAAAERHDETLSLGDAFVEAASAWEDADGLPRPCPYPVAIGALSARQQIGLKDVVTAFLTAFAHSQVSVAVRLVPLGQTDGLHTMAALEPAIEAAADDAIHTEIDSLGAISYAAEIAVMRHETQTVRIFRS